MSISNHIHILKKALIKIGVNIDDKWDEDWHEEAVSEFGSEPVSEEEWAEKNIYTPSTSGQNESKFREEVFPEIRKLLDRNNIKLVGTGRGYKDDRSSHKGEAYLGSGAFGTVYSVLYNGKPAAMKLMKSGNDLEVWSSIERIKDKFPENLRKYFPEIYLLDQEREIQIIVMEMLQPLSDQVREIYTSDNPIFTPDVSIDILDAMMDNFHYFKDYVSIYSEDNELNLPSESEMINEIFENHTMSFKDLKEKIIQFLLRKISPDAKEKISRTFHNHLFRGVLRKIKKSRHFPISYKEVEKEKIPAGLENLYDALMELSKYGIYWDDLHFNNVMMDRDGNIKIVDVGEFTAF